ncbi:MAG: SRPBCC family protein [Agarilytica sp.]
MPRIQVEALISVDRNQLYHLAEDYTRRLEWDRFAARIRFEHGAITSTIGFAGTAHLLNPFRMRVEHVSLAAPSMIAINMLEGPAFFSKLKSIWRFESLEESVTKVVLTCEFRSRWPIVNKAIDPLLAKVLVRDAERILEDFKYAAEDTDVLSRMSESAFSAGGIAAAG